MTDRYFSVADAQARLEELIDLVHKQGDRIFITDENGVPTTVIIPVDEYESLTRQIKEIPSRV